jgi:hypothetical protein
MGTGLICLSKFQWRILTYTVMNPWVLQKLLEKCPEEGIRRAEPVTFPVRRLCIRNHVSS